MPKHVPTFKHLLSRSFLAPDNREKKKEPCFNDLLAQARRNRSDVQEITRDRPGHLVDIDFVSPIPIVPAILEGAPLPGEITRTQIIERNRLARRTPGPAAPACWTLPSISHPSLPSSKTSVQLSSHQIRLYSSLISHQPPSRPTNGTSSLVHYCLMTVLKYVEDETPLYQLSSSTSEKKTITRGEIIRSQISWMDTHTKILLMDISSELEEKHPWRLKDKTMKLLLRPPNHTSLSLDDEQINIVDERGKSSNQPIILDNSWTQSVDTGIGIGIENESDLEKEDSWDEEEDSTSIIHHLPLTLHPSPEKFLKQLNNFPYLSLISLNLTGSTLPTNSDSLVGVLPAVLRELCLSGVRYRGKEDDWWRGIKGMGGKMVLLILLDLSFPPYRITDQIAKEVFQPAHTRFPSLKVLGLRGHISQENSKQDEMKDKTEENRMRRRNVEKSLRGNRKRWVDVIWD
ncbi:hypothetical protein TREMEDRAFT_61601 [Tremella mesenterica DSM 1558]|uniref:uncharacterized protein n=1 Tax=Tremella mesenterica (strain ATCC 24925 / CBS 8224 / DSM 1558 / NBRC 9311 / NRRL Y-6157 / RJB 2259-6 / UBC 559-6) TaxID=578456 RepID=UPI0003F49E2C|nr:uncharacterized protein TREMEDRAFT_61601 [Tremella mesenterica DSM 1558]EIW69830.1 hypothetical protein TREMEDRAFT_61601 [Tremella mesenterica DSM 1558]